jgi:hypothetical protein
MPLAHARRPRWALTFRDGGVRKLHSRNDTEYLLSSPENARRLLAALERSLAGGGREVTLEQLRAEFGLGENE